MPRISVLMPVRNVERYVAAAVQSVLAQTCGDFELLVLDDASTDGTADAVRQLADARLRYVRHDAPRGVAVTLNQGLDAACGEFIARMDGDDLCRPDRFALQLDWLERHPELALCGAWIRIFGERRSFLLSYPTGSDCVRAFLLFDNPLAHPTVMWRREALARHGLRYDETCPAAQDFELWSRCARHVAMDNLPLPLVRYRVHREAVSLARQAASDRQAQAVLALELARLGLQPSPAELQFHREVGHGAGMLDRQAVARAEAWLQRLLAENARRAVYPAAGLCAAAARVWFRVCLNSTHLGPWMAFRYFASPLRRPHRPTARDQALLLARACGRRAGWGPATPTGRLEVWDAR